MRAIRPFSVSGPSRRGTSAPGPGARPRCEACRQRCGSGDIRVDGNRLFPACVTRCNAQSAAPQIEFGSEKAQQFLVGLPIHGWGMQGNLEPVRVLPGQRRAARARLHVHRQQQRAVTPTCPDRQLDRDM